MLAYDEIIEVVVTSGNLIQCLIVIDAPALEIRPADTFQRQFQAALYLDMLPERLLIRGNKRTVIMALDVGLPFCSFSTSA